MAPNIYYLGAANVVRFGDLRVAGLSGIWKGYNYNKPHFERLPYTADEIKSLYHVREIDVRKLLLLRSQVDVGISHDWPRAVEWLGDHKALFRKKDLFEADAKAGTLGSLAAKYVMDRVRPPHWFAAHLHCKFSAIVKHENGSGPSSTTASLLNATTNEKKLEVDKSNGTHNGAEHPAPSEAVPPSSVKNDDEIDLDIDDDDDSVQPEAAIHSEASIPSLVPEFSESSTIPDDIRSQLPASFARPAGAKQERASPAPPPAEIFNTVTKFLALDKCLPNRKFLQLLEIEPSSKSNPPAAMQLVYDPEWLSILRAFRSHDPHEPSPPNIGEAAYMPLIAEERKWVEVNIVEKQKLQIPNNFEKTAPVYNGADIRSVGRQQPREYTNPQTRVFCEMLDMPNFFDASEEKREHRRTQKSAEIEAESRSGGGGRGGGRGGRGFGGSRRGGGGRGRSRGDRDFR